MHTRAARSMEPDNSELDSDELLRPASHLLSRRDFYTSRNYALMARKSDPNVAELNKILAIAEVIISAEQRLPNGHLAYYSILQVRKSQVNKKKLIQTQFEKLAVLLNPSTNKFPFALEALNHVRKAWSVLSDPEKKTQYDFEISSGEVIRGKEPNGEDDVCQQNDTQSCNGPSKGKGFREDRAKESGEQEQGRGHTESVRRKATFWTVCPYCFHLYEYDKVYEECCLVCQQCRRGFHGMAVPPPPASLLVEGNGHYRGFGVFPLGYPGGDFLGNKKQNGVGANRKVGNVVVISDEGDDDLDRNRKNEGFQVREDVFRVGKRGIKYDGIDTNVKTCFEVREDVSRVGEPGIKDNGMDTDVETDFQVKEEASIVGEQGVQDDGMDTNVKTGFQAKEEVSGEGEPGAGMLRSAMRRVKAVARNTKKMMGKGIPKKKIEDVILPKMNVVVENGSEDGCWEDDLGFFEGDEDIYVGIRDAN